MTTYTFEVWEPVSSSSTKRVSQFVGRFSLDVAIYTVDLEKDRRIRMQGGTSHSDQIPKAPIYLI